MLTVVPGSGLSLLPLGGKELLIPSPIVYSVRSELAVVLLHVLDRRRWVAAELELT